MTSLLRRGLALTLFTVGLIAGLQLPGFVKQYQVEVTARLQEAQLALSGFQAVADEYHGGDLAALIAHHRRSNDASFRAEAEVIYGQWKRVAFLQTEQRAMNQPLLGQSWHLLTDADKRLFQHTVANYSAVVPLTTAAAICGVLGGALLLWLGALFWLVASSAAAQFLAPHPNPVPREREQ